MSPIVKTVLQRLGLGVLTLFAVSVIIFFTVTMLPGDFAQAILGQAATPETVAAFDREIGLDRPPVERYLNWLGGVLQGDFGNSFASQGSLGGGHARSVMSLIAPCPWPWRSAYWRLSIVAALSTGWSISSR
jgi:peptide/nickel transport system permease protein